MVQGVFQERLDEYQRLFTHIVSNYMASKKTSAPLPASGAGLLRFFEDETKGVKISPKIVVTMPISLIVLSWLLDIFLIP